MVYAVIVLALGASVASVAFAARAGRRRRVLSNAVVVASEATEDGVLTVVLREPASTGRDTTIVVTGAASLAEASQVVRWQAAMTSLSLVSERRGSLTLHGPTRDASGLTADPRSIPSTSHHLHRAGPSKLR